MAARTELNGTANWATIAAMPAPIPLSPAKNNPKCSPPRVKAINRIRQNGLPVGRSIGARMTAIRTKRMATIKTGGS